MSQEAFIEKNISTSLARELIRNVAPQELPLFEAVSQAYWAKGANEVAKAQRSSEDTLGFGLGEIGGFLTPAALFVATSVVDFLKDSLSESLKDATDAAINGLIAKIFEKKAVLTRDQLSTIRELTLVKAKQLGLSNSQATLLADALIGSLAVGQG